MTIIRNPHDKFFKEVLGNKNIARDFMENYLPEEILGIIEVETLTSLKDSFITDDLKEMFSDLLFSATINGKEGHIYFLFEHKSYQAKNISLQLLKYIIEIWESKLNQEGTIGPELPVVIPLVIYQGRKKWNVARMLGDLIAGYNDLAMDVQKYIPNYEYLIYDLTQFNLEEIKGEIKLRIFLDILKNIQSTNEEHFIASLERGITALLKLNEEKTFGGYFKTFIKYVLNARQNFSVEEALNIVDNISVEGRALVMTAAEELRKEGKKEGKLEVAKKMLQANIDTEHIVDLTGLTIEEIEKIKKEKY